MVNESISLEALPPIPLLGNLDALQAWPLTFSCLFSWFFMLFLPRWKYTPILSLASPLLMGILYTLIFLSILFLMPPDPQQHPSDMFSLKGVMTIFRDPTSALGCWVHYLAFDPLVGRWMLLDSVERGASTKIHILVMIPLLVLTLLMGLMGWIYYMILARPLFLPIIPDNKTKHHAI